MSVAGFDCGDGPESLSGPSWPWRLVEVAAVGDLPFVVDVGQDRADQADEGGRAGKDADDAGSAFVSCRPARRGLVDQTFAQWAGGRRRRPVLRLSCRPSAPRPWGSRGELVADGVPGPPRRLQDRSGEIGPHTAATMSLCDFGTNANRSRAKCTRQR